MEWVKKTYKTYQEVFDYVIFGIMTTLVNILIFFICDTIFNIQYLLANAISIIAAIIFAFFTNKKYVFKSKAKSFNLAFKEFYLFVGLRLVSGLFDMLSMFILVDLINLKTMVAKTLTQFIIVVLNYAFSKLYIFR